jgi:hypothetical protein
MTTSLLKLAERCEGLTGPDRETDEAIERALPPTDARIQLPSLWNERAAKFHGSRIGEYDGDDYIPAAYTASLDAAMSLVPEGRSWRLDKTFTVSGCNMFAKQPFREVSRCRRAATPALALTAACLRALASQGGE